MSDELKKCPFCGEPNDWIDNPYGGLSPACSNTKCPIYAKGMSIKDWQSRPLEDALQKRIAELERAAEIDNQRLVDAAKRAGITYFGCDTPDAIADKIAELEAQLKEIAKESLYRLMLELSEDVFLCGWYDELLSVCKDAVDGKRKLPADYTEKLVKYHKLAGGWWDWNDTTQSVMFIADKRGET